MNAPTNTQRAKLPKWALAFITNCERRGNEAESRLKDYLDKQSESLIYTTSGLSEKSYIQDDRVTFKLPIGEITCALSDGVLECHASYGSARLLVVPHVTNVVHLEIEDTRP